MPRTAPPLCFRRPLRSDAAALIGAGYMIDKRHHVSGRVLEETALVYVLDGGGWWEDDLGRREPLRRGDLLMVLPGVRHSYGPATGQRWSECFLVFRGGVFRELEREGLLSRRQPVLHPGHDPRLVALFDELIRDFATATPRDGHLLAARVHPILAWAARLHEDRSSGGGEVTLADAACAILEERLDAALDLRQVARRLDTGYEHLRKAFARHTGMSLTRYRMQRRIERAQALLTQGRSIDAVALDLGYCDRFFFARQFARVAGLPPGRWLQARRP